jgi:hypothetical protein
LPIDTTGATAVWPAAYFLALSIMVRRDPRLREHIIWRRRIYDRKRQRLCWCDSAGRERVAAVLKTDLQRRRRWKGPNYSLHSFGASFNGMVVQVFGDMADGTAPTDKYVRMYINFVPH